MEKYILPAIFILGFPLYFLQLFLSKELDAMIKERNKPHTNEEPITRSDTIFNFLCYWVAISLGTALGMGWIPLKF